MSFWRTLIKQVGVKSCADCPKNFRYYSRSDKVYYTGITGYSYTHIELEWDPELRDNIEIKRFSIFRSGKVIVHKGAGSDGCTPVYLFLNLQYWGVPNGPVLPTTKEPVTARAFFLHDWLLNVRHKTGMPVDVIHQAFCYEIGKTDFWLKKAYCKMVKSFGPKE